MQLNRWLESTGLFLFRYRSQIPALTLLVFFLVMQPNDGVGFHLANLKWDLLCLAVSLVGLGIRVRTLGSTPEGTSGRNRRHQVANTLNTTGTYSLVRHPLYLGNFIIFFGISMVPHALWIVALNTALFWVFYLPIIYAEEQFLTRKFGEAYKEWMRHTPLVVPWRILRWRSSDRAFSVQTAVRREYQTLFAILAYYALLEMTGDIVEAGHFVIDPVYAGVFLVTLALYVGARYLVKHTHLFTIPTQS